jgi:hypothetical protein
VWQREREIERERVNVPKAARLILRARHSKAYIERLKMYQAAISTGFTTYKFFLAIVVYC